MQITTRTNQNKKNGYSNPNVRIKLLLDAKIGIVKQLYKDNMITATQYIFLLKKYDQKAS